MASVPSYHVLDFFHDDEDGCALTISRNSVRFHIIADAKRLNRETDAQESQEYFRLLQDLRNPESREDGQTSVDSGVDVQSSQSPDSESKGSGETAVQGAEEKLHKWMLAPLAAHLKDLAPEPSPSEEQTLEQWYACKTHFFNIETTDRSIQAVELSSSEDLEERMTKLRPHLVPIPKYISEIDVPWYSSSDLLVLECADTPDPYHPCLVKHPQSGEEMFFKTVDNNNTQPLKREIDILAKIEKKQLRQKLNCPQLLGIVTSATSAEARNRGSIMGFLQTAIKQPTPLTTKFDSAVSQDKRDAWARKADEAKKILHKNGIIWGDAKADNFIVDAEDRLWIIDFGGSYTEGWVDPEIAETKQGDNMGVGKIVNALRDPDRNVAGSETSEGNEGEDGRVASTAGRTRKRVDGSHDNHPAKRRKMGSSKKDRKQEENRYCYCGEESSGQMIGCDGPDCEMEWFHIGCTDITVLPAKDEAWYCNACKA